MDRLSKRQVGYNTEDEVSKEYPCSLSITIPRRLDSSISSGDICAGNQTYLEKVLTHLDHLDDDIEVQQVTVRT